MLNDKLKENIINIIKSKNAELYDIELIRENEYQILRISVINEVGINVDVCEEISHLISPLLDVENPINGEYFLEVSSPGIERNLKTEKHYKTAIGEKIKVKIDGKKSFIDTLLSTTKNSIILEENGEILLDSIKKANTIFSW